MIDINKLRRLAQAATPGPWINHGRQPNVAGLPHSAVAAKTLLARVYSEAYGDVAQETANADLIAAANPAVISELLDRLESAERERDDVAQQLVQAEIGKRKLEAECEALRAKVAQMERQEPVGKFIRHPSNGLWEQDGYGDNPDARPLYALPGAQTQGEEK